MTSSANSTWLSPPLLRPRTRKAMSPKPVQAPATTEHPIRLRPVSSKTVGALSSFTVSQYSSFSADDCFPAAVTVRDPLLRAESQMTRELARCAIKNERRRQQVLEVERHEQCTAELTELLMVSSAALRSPSALSNYQADHVEIQDSQVPVLRVETPIPRHPLQRVLALPRGKTSRPATGSTDWESTAPKGRHKMSWSIRKVIAAPAVSTPSLSLNLLLRDNLSRPQTATSTIRIASGDDAHVRPLRSIV